MFGRFSKQPMKGYVGDFSKEGFEVISSCPVNSVSEPIYYGDPVTLLGDNTLSRFTENSLAEKFSGIAVRRKRQRDIYNSLPYLSFEPCDFISVGYVNVICRAGTPSTGGTVYVRIKNPKNDKPIGGFEASRDIMEENQIEVKNLIWASDVIGASNIALINIKERNQ